VGVGYIIVELEFV